MITECDRQGAGRGERAAAAVRTRVADVVASQVQLPQPHLPRPRKRPERSGQRHGPRRLQHAPARRHRLKRRPAQQAARQRRPRQRCRQTLAAQVLHLQIHHAPAPAAVVAPAQGAKHQREAVGRPKVRSGQAESPQSGAAADGHREVGDVGVVQRSVGEIELGEGAGGAEGIEEIIGAAGEARAGAVGVGGSRRWDGEGSSCTVEERVARIRDEAERRRTAGARTR